MLAGPTRLRPGPALLKQAIIAEKEVIKSKPVKSRVKTRITIHIKYKKMKLVTEVTMLSLTTFSPIFNGLIE